MGHYCLDIQCITLYTYRWVGQGVLGPGIQAWLRVRRQQIILLSLALLTLSYNIMNWMQSK